MKRTLVALLGTLLVPTCFAVGLDARADGATIIVNDQPIVTLKTKSGDLSPEKRALIAVQAIQSAFGLTVYSGVDDGTGRIAIGERKILSISHEEAKAQKKSVHDLTDDIADRLQSALSEIGFAVYPRQVWMVTNGSAEISLVGPRASKVQIKAITPGIVSFARGTEKIILSSNAAGTTILNLRLGTEVEEVIVNVLPPAGKINEPNAIQVVGRPADKATVESAIVRSVRAAIDADPTAEIIVEVDAQELVPAQRTTIPVKVTLRAPWKFPVEQQLDVEARNIGPHDNKTEELWYSNDPEVLKAPGRLYWARLAEGGAARMLYHHQNMSGRPLMLKYSLVNTSDLPLKAALTLGDSTPHKNPTYAGYMAGQEFFPRWVSGSASVVEVPPHSVVPIVAIGMKPGQTASGLMSLHHISGPLALVIGECEAATIEGIAQTNIASQLPTKNLADFSINLAGSPQHVYSPAERSIKIEYEVGGRFGYARIGQVPVGRVDDEGALSGNFGIVYKIEATLSNRTNIPTDIEFVYESSAGYGGAYFRINGSVVKTPLLQAKEAFRLLKFRLEPGEKKTFYLETIPLSGGSYPVTLTIKPVGVG